MKLKQLIEKIDNNDMLSIEDLYPYRKQIYKYYSNLWIEEPVFMITFLTNNSVGGKIVPMDQFQEAMEYETEDEEMQESEKEHISANSKMLRDML